MRTYLDRRGRIVERGIYSEENPTLLSDRGAVRTECVAMARSRRSYGRAQALLKTKLPRWTKA